MSSPLKPCLTAECNVRHRLAGAYCTACNRQRQQARNETRKPLYGGKWRALSRQARKAQPWCSICGATTDLTLDHQHGRVECKSCNSSHRRNVG